MNDVINTNILRHYFLGYCLTGSTNTGYGLEKMRGMFDPRYGDRDRAPNYCILLTDGQSDDYNYTIDQAKLAKMKGEK